MTNIIYGVDADSIFTTIGVRDAIILCFKQAHSDILKQTLPSTIGPEEFEKFKDIDVKMLVKQMFETTGGDYDKPTKESLLKVMDGLKEFAGQFRAESIIAEHYNQIMVLINKLK